jgi:hypothetical protein
MIEMMIGTNHLNGEEKLAFMRWRLFLFLQKRIEGDKS